MYYLALANGMEPNWRYAINLSRKLLLQEEDEENNDEQEVDGLFGKLAHFIACVSLIRLIPIKKMLILSSR